MMYSCLFEICGLMRGRPWEKIPEGEMKRMSLFEEKVSNH